MADYKDKNSVGEEAAGLGERVKGNVKEGWGDATDNSSLERGGRREADEGRMRQASNDVTGEAPGRGNSRLVTGLYRSREDAERASGDLTSRHGYKPDDVSV